MSEVEALYSEKIELRHIATDLLESLEGLLADIQEY